MRGISTRYNILYLNENHNTQLQQQNKYRRQKYRRNAVAEMKKKHD